MVKSFISTIYRKWHSYHSIPLVDRLFIPVIFIFLGFARLAILLLPFRHYAKTLGGYRKTLVYTPLLNNAEIQQARRVGRLVRMTAKNTPWQSLCLVQAVVASLLLRLFSIPYILHFGLAKNHDIHDKDPMKAHAWVTAGPIAVTGGRSLSSFTVVGSYTSPLLQEECCV